MTKDYPRARPVTIKLSSEDELKLRQVISAIIQGMTPASYLDAADITDEVIQAVLSYAYHSSGEPNEPPR